MGTSNQCGHTQEHSISQRRSRPARSGRLASQRGIAMVFALILSLTIMALAAGVLYFVNQSSQMSGAGKMYATASEAADGTVNLMKDVITKTIRADETLDTLIANTGLTDTTVCLTPTILGSTLAPCPMSVLLGAYTANIALTFLSRLPKGSIEFADQNGTSSVVTSYKINVAVVGPDNTSAEDSVLYRFSQ